MKVMKMNKMSNLIFLRDQRVKKNKKVVKVINKENNNYQLVVNVLINYVLQKKSIKKLDQEYNKINIDSFVKIVIKIIIIIYIVNFVNKSIQIIVKIKMMING